VSYDINIIDGPDGGQLLSAGGCDEFLYLESESGVHCYELEFATFWIHSTDDALSTTVLDYRYRPGLT